MFVKPKEREVTEKTLDKNWIAIQHGVSVIFFFLWVVNLIVFKATAGCSSSCIVC